MLDVTISPQVIGNAIYFVVGLVVTTVIIYIATHLMSERGGWGKAFLAALIGYIIYYVFHFIVVGFLGAIIGFLVCS